MIDTNSGKQTRTLGLFGATSVGVGAIVGGGILALAGIAFATTGPAAILAFAINGMIAMLTALSFAEMASKFPESGGTYTFSKKALSVEAAFSVGWVVWFASILAASLYALGFGYFALLFFEELFETITGRSVWTRWESGERIVAMGTTVLLAIALTVKKSAGGNWANIGKLIVFSILIIGGLFATLKQDPTHTVDSLRPFFKAGWLGLIQAMGFTFIALQGFDLIAAVGGEVKNPTKNIPRAMILSLLIALCVYLPLLFVISVVGVDPGDSIGRLATEIEEGVVAQAASNFLGPFGYWLVIVAAVLSMFSALYANLFAASRIARAMARDRNLPSRLANLHQRTGNPVNAILVTCGLVLLIEAILSDVASAGAASSLIFLITFALAHWICILIRQRSGSDTPPFRVPWFPVIPVVGGLACIALAIFQGVAVPQAGWIALIWLGVGGFLFLTLFARRARMRDASSLAMYPELSRLRGRSPLALVPIAYPESARGLIELADAFVPRIVGRVLLQTIVVAPKDWKADENVKPLLRAQSVWRELVAVTANSGINADTLTSIAPEPMVEIVRTARLHRCQSVLLGFSEISVERHGSDQERLLSEIQADLLILRAGKSWRLESAKKILVPVAGRGGHERLLARLLGSLVRLGPREITFLRILPTTATNAECRKVRRDLERLARDKLRKGGDVEIVLSDEIADEIIERAKDFDLLILGVQRVDRKKKIFGQFIRNIASKTDCPMIVISRRG